MEGMVDMELCPNCKREIPSTNYVVHTVHCSRNISLCPTCKEPVPKSELEKHKSSCFSAVKKREEPAKKVSTNQQKTEAKSFQAKSFVQESQSSSSFASKRQNSITSSEKLSSSYKKEEVSKKYGSNSDSGSKCVKNEVYRSENLAEKKQNSGSSKSSMLPCKYCDLELPKLDLEDHENYCGSRTDKCMECGELVMFKYKQLHEDTNHGFLKLTDEPGPKASWDSNTQRSATSNSENDSYRRNRPPAYRPFSTTFDISQYATFSPASLGFNGSSTREEKKESYKDISRRLDCKTEYIRNLLHDSASITIPLRSTGSGPRNHFNHNKGPAPQPPSRRRNPPAELLVPCEFCNLPIPHEDLVGHEMICRPNVRRGRRLSPGEDDYSMPLDTASGYSSNNDRGYTSNSDRGYTTSGGYNPQSTYMPSASEVPYSPSNTNPDDDELPCEFCSEMLPASQLWRHQMTCS